MPPALQSERPSAMGGGRPSLMAGASRPGMGTRTASFRLVSTASLSRSSSTHTPKEQQQHQQWDDDDEMADFPDFGSDEFVADFGSDEGGFGDDIGFGGGDGGDNDEDAFAPPERPKPSRRSGSSRNLRHPDMIMPKSKFTPARSQSQRFLLSKDDDTDGRGQDETKSVSLPQRGRHSRSGSNRRLQNDNDNGAEESSSPNNNRPQQQQQRSRSGSSDRHLRVSRSSSSRKLQDDQGGKEQEEEEEEIIDEVKVKEMFHHFLANDRQKQASSRDLMGNSSSSSHHHQQGGRRSSMGNMRTMSTRELTSSSKHSNHSNDRYNMERASSGRDLGGGGGGGGRSSSSRRLGGGGGGGGASSSSRQLSGSQHHHRSARRSSCMGALGDNAAAGDASAPASTPVDRAMSVRELGLASRNSRRASMGAVLMMDTSRSNSVRHIMVGESENEEAATPTLIEAESTTTTASTVPDQSIASANTAKMARSKNMDFILQTTQSVRNLAMTIDDTESLYKDIVGVECEICIHSGQDLAAKDRNLLGKLTSSDPFVEIWKNLPTQKVATTRIIKKNLDPVWDESFSVKWDEKGLSRSLSDRHHTKLTLKVYDSSPFSAPDAMGNIEIVLPKAEGDQPLVITEQYFDIDPASAKNAKGRLKVSLAATSQRKK